MRIISGKWRGHKLVSFESKQIRPTTDFVKENIFNMIGPDIVDSKVLDLFAGTGSLGFEAASRGAADVVAVDKGKDSLHIVKKNAEKLKVDDTYKYFSKDVFSFLKTLDQVFDFILIDPPFTEKLAADCIKAVSETKIFHADTRIFIECVKGEEILEEAGALRLDRKKSYGDKLLCIYYVDEGN